VAHDVSCTSDRRRPWWRLHLLTLLAAAGLAGLLAWCNLHSISPYGQPVTVNVTPPMGLNPNRVHVLPMGSFTMTLEGVTRGWPLRWRDYWERTTAFAPPSRQAPVVEKEVLTDSPAALAADVAVAVLIVVCAAFLTEQWLRGGRRLQFTLRGMLVAVAVAAVALSVWRVHGKLETALGQENLVTRIFEFPAPVYVPVLAGVTCAVYVVFSLAAGIAFGSIGLAMKATARKADNLTSSK
jgi:hypothetical protein